MYSSDLEFGVLGPLAVRQGDADVVLGGPRQRLVLAVLLLEAGRVCPAERLVDLIWGEAAPATGTGPLRTYVWQLRRLLGSGGASPPGGGSQGVLVSRGLGYLLDIDRSQIDSVRFENLFAAGRTAAASGQLRRALGRLDEALGLWRGPAFGDLAAEPAVREEAIRLEQLRFGAKELRAELMLAAGQHVEVAAELGALARAHPEREGLWAMLMTALYRSGRQGDALRCFQEARGLLIDQMGIEPGPELRELEQQVLVHDPCLSWQPRPELPEGEPAPGTGGTGDVPVAAPSVPHNLPRQLTSFVGRGAELKAVTGALERSRLVTLTGSGGCGKTRLALAVATEVRERFQDGVWFVDLSAVSDPELLDRAIAEPMGVETDQEGQLDHICRWIAGGRVLLVIDNCEHVVDAVAKTAEALLLNCPALCILATSREELGIGAEAVWRVPALSLPVLDDVGDDGSGLMASEAVQLFVERARSALAGFDPDGEALEAVAQICQRLEGIPLALELAAALVGSLPVAEISDRLDDRLGLLASSRREGVERHRTLRATLDWSYELLDEPARTLFVQLGVFVGDFTLAAAEAVAGHDRDPLAVVRGMGHLVRTSMAGCVAGPGGAERYRMLETVRQYARERLDEWEDAEEIHRRHARYYADFAAEAERHVHGPAASEWLTKVVAELPNLRAAVSWAISRDDIETGLRLAGSLRWFFARMAMLDEAARWLDVGLHRRDELPPDLRLMALTAASTVAFMRGEFSQTRELGEEGVALARQQGDAHQLAIALIVRGAGAVYEGHLERGTQCFDEATMLCRRLGDRWGTAWMLTGKAVASRRAGELDLARRQLEESLEIFRDLQDEHGQVLPLVNLALAAQEEGYVDDARRSAEEAVRLAAELADRQLQHVSLCVLGRVELSRGQRRRARDLLMRSIRNYPGAHHRLMLAIAIEGLAELAASAGHHHDAVALRGHTRTMRRRWRISLTEAREREGQALLEAAGSVIGVEGVESELARGQALSFDEAVDLAARATAGLGAEGSGVREARPGSLPPP